MRTYATGLLAGAMENQDIAANYREENSQMVRIVKLLGIWQPREFVQDFPNHKNISCEFSIFIGFDTFPQVK